MDFHKAQVTGWVALQGANGLGVQPHLGHGLAHGNAVGIGLIQPSGVELPHQGPRAQKRGPVALAFFFGKGHDLNAVVQAPALAGEFAHTGHGHQDAQTPVVLAPIAHRVVMRAGEQALGLGRCPVIDAHHIAHRVGVDLVKAAGLHAQGEGLGAGLVRGGEVGDGQLAALGKAGIAELRQPFVPVPDLLAQAGVNAKFVVEANFGNAVDVAQGLGEFKVHRVAQTPLPGGDDLCTVQPLAARAPHRQDEGKAKFGVVVAVELLDLGQLLRIAMGQARSALLIGGGGGQGIAQHGLAGQFRVGTDQCELRFTPRRAQHLHHGLFQVCGAGEGALGQGFFGDPIGVLVQAMQGLQCRSGRHRIQFVKAECHGASW